MSNEHILLALADAEAGQFLERTALSPAGYQVTLVSDWKAIESVLQNDPPALIIISEQIEGQDSTAWARAYIANNPLTPVILLARFYSDKQIIQTLRQGFADCFTLPARRTDIETIVSRALERRQNLHEQLNLLTRRDTSSLRKRMNGLETIERVGRKVASSLDLDSILSTVVEAAVDMTGAEEGSLLLIDESSGELYMRASRNFQEDFAKTFRMPVHDSLVSQVIKTGKPVTIDEKTPQKIKTAYLVQTLLYVPLIIQDRVIGVLGVDHRLTRKAFSPEHIKLVSAIADYAAIAIENARLYYHSEYERSQLESILKGIEECVIVVDSDRRLVLINRKAREAFGITEPSPIGRRIREVIQHQELLDVLRDNSQSTPSRTEITLDDGRVLNAQLTPLAGIGLVVTMQDITHLKELDRIKSDFVNTVSHDLRSPLTAILGYVELIERVGAVNSQQREFIRRIQISVHNITSLINDLLDLGRIEAGFDARKEVMPFSAIVHYAVDSLAARFSEKSQTLETDIPDDLPQVLGNPVRLRQMLSNLVLNAIKYTPPGGKITVTSHVDAGQIILQITDTGPGIPSADQPFIFDKFYRASNVSPDTPGTGLGLAIVKSIVENHQGRIWVDSALGQGTTFTIVLPIIDREL